MVVVITWPNARGERLGGGCFERLARVEGTWLDSRDDVDRVLLLHVN